MGLLTGRLAWLRGDSKSIASADVPILTRGLAATEHSQAALAESVFGDVFLQARLDVDPTLDCLDRELPGFLESLLDLCRQLVDLAHSMLDTFLAPGTHQLELLVS